MEVALLGHPWTPARNWSGQRWSCAGPGSCHADPPTWTPCTRTSGYSAAASRQTWHCCRETTGTRGRNCKERRGVAVVTGGPGTLHPKHKGSWTRGHVSRPRGPQGVFLLATAARGSVIHGTPATGGQGEPRPEPGATAAAHLESPQEEAEAGGSGVGGHPGLHSNHLCPETKNKQIK